MTNTPSNRSKAPEDEGEDEQAAGEPFDPSEYDTLMQLERLESLEEEMIEAGVTTLEELRERIASLHRELDAAQ